MTTTLETAITAGQILVVDDDRATRGLLKKGLGAFGYEVHAVSGMVEARRWLRSEACSLVLCDYDLDGDTGLDLLASLRDDHPDLPFILLTGHDETLLAREAIANGAVDFVAKPFELRQLARAIEQNLARLDRDRERAVQLTDDILQGTIRALVAAVDAKDPHTASHSERVAHVALRLGAAIRLSAERLRVLEFAALLHDVGKIGVPQEILMKPGRLDPQEWAIIKRHPARSAEIVSEVKPLSEVASIIRHHHERVDGSGYPDGLAGGDIPLLSRLICIADAYEALTCDRAYRPAMSRTQARAIIREGLGSQFDASLGETFLNLDDIP